MGLVGHLTMELSKFMAVNHQKPVVGLPVKVRLNSELAGTVRL